MIEDMIFRNNDYYVQAKEMGIFRKKRWSTIIGIIPYPSETRFLIIRSEFNIFLDVLSMAIIISRRHADRNFGTVSCEVSGNNKPLYAMPTYATEYAYEWGLNERTHQDGKKEQVSRHLSDYVLTANLDRASSGEGNPGRVTSAIRSPGGGRQPL